MITFVFDFDCAEEEDKNTTLTKTEPKVMAPAIGNVLDHDIES